MQSLKLLSLQCRHLLLMVTAILLLTACEQPEAPEAPAAPDAPSSDAESAAAEVPLIDRDVLFGNPTRFQGRLSPDGKQMSFRAPLDGVMNIWIAPAGDIEAAKPITQDQGRGIPIHFWALDSKNVFYIQDKNGDENWHLHMVNLASGESRDLTPYEGVRANMMKQSEDIPGTIIVGMNDRDPRWHDVYSVELESGERKLLQQNDQFASFVVDNDFDVRLASEQTPGGGINIFEKDGDEWKLLFEFPLEDVRSSSIIGFDGENTGIYMLDSRGRDTAALTHMNLSTGETKVVAESDVADLSNVLLHPRTMEPIAYAVNYHKAEWHAVSDEYQADVEALNAGLEGHAQILAMTQDASRWTVYSDLGDQSPVYQVYDRASKTLSDMFVTNTKLDGIELAGMHNKVIKSRDGLDLVSYLTLPVSSDTDGNGIPESPVPLVLVVHGGPWARDTYGYQGNVQWLANRGYGVLQVNFRGSTGFGKSFINAGNLEWGRAMHDDLIDAVEWAVSEKMTTREQVAIMGGSYGGYATLAGLTFTPEVFACGVDIVGPSNLITLLESIPPYWQGILTTMTAAMGDPATEEGRELLASRSPVNFAENITKPLLIGQGANDPRVKQAESDQIVDAMKARDIPVTYILFPDEGHGFQKPENSLAFFAVTEQFLASCLNGRSQPIGDDFAGSSIQIPHGAEFVAGVQEALP